MKETGPPKKGITYVQKIRTGCLEGFDHPVPQIPEIPESRDLIPR